MYNVLPIFRFLIKNIHMENTFISKWTTQVKKGLLLYLVMTIIKKKNSYGYEIIQKIEKETGLQMAEGTLYPLLQKLKDEKMVLCKWEVNEEDAPRKYYYLTGVGNSTLREMDNYWLGLNPAINNLIKS